MKMPRDISPDKLITALGKINYFVSQQKGSHIRLQNNKLKNVHHITIPNHSPIKIGTLNNILKEIADKFEISKEELAKQLFQ